MSNTATKPAIAPTAVKPIPDGYHTITPGLVYKDAKKALEFYKKALGAETHGDMCMCTETNKVMHAELKIGDSIFALSDEMPAFGCLSAESLNGAPGQMYLYVKDCDATFKRAIDAGATSLQPVMDMFWGDRVGTIKDPFGYRWSFATHKQDLTKDQIEAGKKAFAEQMKAKMASGSCTSAKSCS
jgi:uncharacterized glyoxalase superfamily protein PhnB